MSIQIQEITYKIHPLCQLFPYMDEKTFEVLKDDMDKYGQRDTIKIYKEEILDGKNRLLICKELNIEPRIEILPDDTDICAYVRAFGLCRRDLEPDERIRIAVNIRKYELKKNSKKEKIIKELKKDPKQRKIIEKKEIKEISKEANSTPKTVKQYLKIEEKAIQNGDKFAQEQLEQIKENKISIEKAHKNIFATKPKKDKYKKEKKSKKELEQELLEIKQEKILLENQFRQIIEILKNHKIWNEIKEQLYPIFEKVPSLEPTIKELRKAELL